jgi:acetyl esterase/lipase
VISEFLAPTRFMDIRVIRILLCCLLLPVGPSARAYDIPGYTPDQIIPFKQTVNSTGGAVTLNLHVFTPPGHQPSRQRPAIVFFFGGGWVDGSASHFHPQCEYLAARGMVAISAEYRVKNLHGTTPQECVKDGKSAIRYVRQNAAALGVDPNRIAAGGGSAGGHVAAATGTLSAYEEPGENLAISSKPNALVLYNPVVDNGPGGYGHTTVQAYWQNISPLHNLSAAAPPTVFFLGTSDALIPVSVGTNYRSAMESFGLRCDLHLYQDQPHSFFNFDVPDDSSGPFYGYQDTLFKTDEFLVSLGYLPEPHDAPVPATGWVTVSGNAAFGAGSAATASPVTTDADDDAIAAGFAPVNLTEGEFIRLSGTVTLNAPLAEDKLRIGLFDGDNPVTAGDGGGYQGIWAGVPAGNASVIASGNGTGLHPFNPSTTLGPVPAASSLPGNTPIHFSLMLARNGGKLDIAVSFHDGASYRPSQNLLNLTSSSFTFDSAAFWLDGATQASFTNIRITTGPALPSLPPPVAGEITYIDAVDGSSGNTFKTGSIASDTSWVGADSSTVNNTQWGKRLAVEGNGGTLFQGLIETNTLPELTTRITGLADGTYAIWAFYWDQVIDDAQNWSLNAGLASGSLTTYSSPGEPAVGGATSVGVTSAAELDFSNSVTVQAGWNGSVFLRQLFGINLGHVTVSGGAPVHVYLDHSNTGGSNRRAWYDGVGYQPINGQTGTATFTRLLGVDFNRDDAPGSPSQSGFRVISGSAANSSGNSAFYSKTFGARQVTVSQPGGANFEFRGANTDSTRAIPGGDTSMPFLVSDFIATREGAIDISITGLAAGGYRFRSWHLDTFTGSALGFAQGSGSTTPNLLEARINGLVRGAVQPTALGSAGLNTTFINNAQIPALDFTFIHDGGPTLTLKLRALRPNASENFLPLNGFELLQENP